MKLPDLINGLFEFGGGLLLIKNCLTLYRDKQVRGVFWPATAFFMVWGYWNMFFYPALGQWLSFAGGVFVTVPNTMWVLMAVYYTRRK